jgi:hypothetical protein
MLRCVAVSIACLALSLAAMACSSGSVAQSASSGLKTTPAGGGPIGFTYAERASPGPAPVQVTGACEASKPPNVRRLLANPKALRLGRVVFTPLALLGSIEPQPYPARGAPEARATKIGAVLFGGAGRARITIEPRRAARLAYGDELNQKLSTGDIAWSAIPSSIVLIACTDAQGRPRATGFPGGFLFRNGRVCRIRLSVSSGGVRVTRSLPVGSPACD